MAHHLGNEHKQHESSMFEQDLEHLQRDKLDIHIDSFVQTKPVNKTHVICIDNHIQWD